MSRRSNPGRERRQQAQPVVMSVRARQVCEVLNLALEATMPADQCLSLYFRENKQLGSRDRLQVAQATFDVLRHLRRYRRDAQSGPKPLVYALAVRGLAATIAPGRQLDEVIKPEDLAWAQHCDQIDPSTLAFEVRYSLPDWLSIALQSLPDPQGYGHALLMGAPVDLRVNSLKSTREAVLLQLEERFAGTSFDAQATPYASHAIRLKGHPPINRWDLYEQGLIEVQDEGSQLLAELVDPKRGEMVIDFCAGAGGKTLALGAMMRSTGRLYAFDISAARLARAKPRFARSGLSNIHPVVIRGERDDRVSRLAGKAHRVLVDAPCTGVGTLRRNPDLKWRLTPTELGRLIEQQQSILQQASRCLRSGGRLVYATCSFLPEENERQVEVFLQNNPDFVLVPATECLREGLKNIISPDGFLRLRPDVHQTDGFFAAVLQKST
jgi:16S rRNA (cytosine967-C5)-methyltransferase